MRKYIIAIMLLLFIGAGATIFIIQNKKSHSADIDYFAAKGLGPGIYNYNLLFKKGATVKEIVSRLAGREINSKEKIMKLNRGKYSFVTQSQKIYSESIFKISNR